MRHILYKSCYSVVSVINNNGFVSKDCIVREGFMHSMVKMTGQILLGGQINCSLMAVEDELPFLTSGFFLRVIVPWNTAVGVNIVLSRVSDTKGGACLTGRT